VLFFDIFQSIMANFTKDCEIIDVESNNSSSSQLPPQNHHLPSLNFTSQWSSTNLLSRQNPFAAREEDTRLFAEYRKDTMNAKNVSSAVFGEENQSDNGRQKPTTSSTAKKPKKSTKRKREEAEEEMDEDGPKGGSKREPNYTNEETSILISGWQNHIDLFSTPTVRNDIYLKIWEDCVKLGKGRFERSAESVGKKIQNMTAAYKLNKDKHTGSGSKPSAWEWFDKMDKLLGHSNYLNPENLINYESTKPDVLNAVNDRRNKRTKKEQQMLDMKADADKQTEDLIGLLNNFQKIQEEGFQRIETLIQTLHRPPQYPPAMYGNVGFHGSPFPVPNVHQTSQQVHHHPPPPAHPTQQNILHHSLPSSQNILYNYYPQQPFASNEATANSSQSTASQVYFE